MDNVTTATNPVDEEIGNFSSIRTGVNLLIVLIYGGLTVILVGIFIQRALLRIVPKYAKGHADVEYFAPKAIRNEIDKRLQQTLRVAFEPRLLPEDDPRCCFLSSGQSESDKNQCNYLYRMKAVDDIKKLESALERTDETLKRHPLKDLRQHLRDVKSHSSGVLRMVRSSQMKALTDAYEHARYKPENFGEKEYQKYTAVLNEILSGIENKREKKKRKSKKQTSQRNSNNSHSGGATSSKTEKPEVGFSSDRDPLLEKYESTTM